MKIFILLLMTLGISALIVVSFAKEKVISLANHYLHERFGDALDVEITDLELSMPHFEAVFLLGHKTVVQTHGKLKLLSGGFELDYKLITPNIFCNEKALNRDFYMHGKAHGGFKSIHFDGNGTLYRHDDHAPLATICLEDAHIDAGAKRAQSDYVVKIQDLSTITLEKYKGALTMFGQAHYREDLEITGGSETLGGFVSFAYAKEALSLKFHHVDALKTTHIIGYPKLVDAAFNGVAEYDFAHEKGGFDLAFKEMRFVDSSFLSSLPHDFKSGLLDQTYAYGSFLGKIEGEHLMGEFKAQNHDAHLYLSTLSIDHTNDTLNTQFDFKTQKTALRGNISGDLYAPNIQTDSGTLLAYGLQKAAATASDFEIKSKIACFKRMADSVVGGFFR